MIDRRLICMLGALALLPGVAVPMPVQAQTNDNEYTPLGSRIRHDRAFPNEPRATFDRQAMSDAERERGRSMADMLARCMWNRGNDKGLDLLARTDLGFYQFEQIGISSNEIGRFYPISHCLSNVAERHNSGVSLRFSAPGIRQSYLQAAYFDLYPDGPSWLQPGAMVAARELPLSAADASVRSQLDFADCVVVTEPERADYFFRTAPGSAGERPAIEALVPAIGECLPEGVQMTINPGQLRIMVGEGLWQAARHSVTPTAPATVTAAAETPEESQ